MYGFRPQSPLGPPRTMTSLLAHTHTHTHTHTRKRNRCIFRVLQLTQAGLNSRITESELNKCKKCKKNVRMPDGCHLRFEEYLQGKNNCSSVSMILELCRLTGKCFEETLRGGNDVKNLEIF